MAIGRTALTLSGGVITDVERRAARLLGLSASGQMCDGLLEDGSLGIRRAATNLFRRGQCDATTDWNVNNAGMTATVDAATAAPFSPQCIKYVVDGTVQQLAWAQSAAGQAAAAGVNGVGSVYFKGTAGLTYQTRMVWTHTDASNAIGAFAQFVATGGWQLVTPPAVAVAAAKVGDVLGVQVGPVGARAETYRVAHAMLESGQSVVAPYVATSGGATATHAAGRVQASAALLNPTQGWVAIRMRAGAADTASSGNRPFFIGVDTSGTNRISGTLAAGGVQINSNGGATQTVTKAATWAAGDILTQIFAWTASTLSVSVNGSAFTSAARTQTPVGTFAVFDIGSFAGTSGWLDGDVLWLGCGTGTLTDADAAKIHAKFAAGAEPTIGELALAGIGPTGVVRGYALT